MNKNVNYQFTMFLNVERSIFVTSLRLTVTKQRKEMFLASRHKTKMMDNFY